MADIIDHELYGQPTTFATIEEAEAAILDCGVEFAHVRLRYGSTDDNGDRDIYDDRDNVIGRHHHS